MREILLRFWDKENKSMVYQNKESLFPLSYYKIVCDCFTDFEFRLFKLKNNTMNFEEVESVKMQYTGLKDMNGIKIYESDIVEYVNKGTKGIGKIVYGLYDNEHQTDLGYYIQWLNQEYWRNDLGYWKKKGIEVRGNIYENSELLEEKR
ncbi:YopX family protein [Terrisporobacter muris]|uniref:YopX family protein n=1 Tax=Terrisporobacter muris TaxID=2963284 RepID=A0A9X2S0D8_9FIRM|nr:YopX family protein [Terrisporobacter muris]MCR1821730.1 YopX family protein [Terrisporobacter muris]